MIRRVILIIISLIMIFVFTGCQLAIEGKGTTTNTDALCGIFITFGPLYSEEDYFDDIDWVTVMSGGQQMYNAERKQIYASERLDKYGGKDYFFEGIDGLRMMGVLIPSDGEYESYWTTCSDDELLEVKSTFGDTLLNLDGTLYVYINPKLYNEDGDCILFSNPVYQTSDGRVYTVPAEYGLGIHQGAGLNKSTTLSTNTTRTIDGREESWTAEIKLSIVGINNIRKYVFKQMDAQDDVISALEIRENSIPEGVTLSGSAAYAILEEHSIDVSGNAVTERSIIRLDTEYFNVRFPGEKGFALTHSITLKSIPDKAAADNA